MNRLHHWFCHTDFWGKQLSEGLMPWALGDLDLGPEPLEIGPGPGLGTDVLRRRAERLTSLEIDPQLAGALRARLAGTNVTVVEGDACAMPFPDASFSGATSFTMLHHVPSPEQQDRLLSETLRVLRPGGWLVGTDSVWSPLFGLFHLFDTCMTVAPHGLAARLSRAGFAEVDVQAGRGSFRFRARRSLGSGP